MTALYLLNVPENVDIARVAAEASSVTTRMVGPYFEFTSDEEIVVDRRATGVRHAVWYSAVAALGESQVTQHDKNALRVRGRA
jgi:hypothetical protein